MLRDDRSCPPVQLAPGTHDTRTIDDLRGLSGAGPCSAPRGQGPSHTQSTANNQQPLHSSIKSRSRVPHIPITATSPLVKQLRQSFTIEPDRGKNARRNGLTLQARRLRFSPVGCASSVRSSPCRLTREVLRTTVFDRHPTRIRSRHTLRSLASFELPYGSSQDSRSSPSRRRGFHGRNS